MSQISEFLIQTFLMAGLPFILRIVAENRNRKPEDRIHRPKTTIDKIASVALILGVVYEFIGLFCFKPTTLFKTLNLSYNTNNYLLRNRCREYIVDLYGQEYASFDPYNIRPNQLSDNIDEIRKLATLCRDLEEPEKRATYLKFGDDAYTQCSWCEENGDYLVYTLSRSSVRFIYMLALLGAVTSTTRKNIWRFWSVTLVAGVALLEIFMYLTQESNVLDKSLFEEVDYNRHGLFILILVLVWIFDRSDEKTDEELTQEIIDRTIAMINRSQATELCTAATLTDSTLRKMFIDYYEKKEVERSVVFSSPEYNDVRLKVIAKYNLEQMIENSNKMSETIMNNYRKIKNKDAPPPPSEKPNTTKKAETSGTPVANSTTTN